MHGNSAPAAMTRYSTCLFVFFTQLDLPSITPSAGTPEHQSRLSGFAAIVLHSDCEDLGADITIIGAELFKRLSVAAWLKKK